MKYLLLLLIMPIAYAEGPSDNEAYRIAAEIGACYGDRLADLQATGAKVYPLTEGIKTYVKQLCQENFMAKLWELKFMYTEHGVKFGVEDAEAVVQAIKESIDETLPLRAYRLSQE